MTRYLIAFPSSAMNHVPADELPAVGEAAQAVVREAMAAGVWVFGGGLAEDVDPILVAGDGTITPGTYPQNTELNGGFSVLDVPSREAAEEWAAKFAAACRCPQELREFMPDPEVGN
ncbi:MAG TPA: YciI family protein [Gaiellaceae bacterium]|nr:YciI family protein [Gaiellaceae bacterium]